MHERAAAPPGEEAEAGLEGFALEPGVSHLNHGSFGACPSEVLARQTELRARLEDNPMRFFVRELPELAERARAAIARFVGAEPEDLAFVSNATQGVATVLRSLRLAPGDELLVTDHAYAACAYALERRANETGACVVVAPLALPIAGEDAAIEALLDVVTNRTRLALVDHVTSPTALVLPIRRIVAELEARGVDCLVDAAHAPGMVDVALDRVGAAYTTANLHKWVCAPKGAAFLHVRRDRQAGIVPLATSHGMRAPLSAGQSRFRAELGWQGTLDPTAILSVPDALAFLERRWPGGLTGLRARNHALAVRARAALADHFGTEPIAPAAMLGSMAAVVVPGPAAELTRSALEEDPLQAELARRFGVEVPVVTFRPALAGAAPLRLLRVSAQAYVRWADVERLLAALREIERG